MAISFSKKVVMAVVPFLPYLVSVQAQASGTGTTTRYWDCCKPSCAWSNVTTLATGATPVLSCDIDNNPLTDFDAASGCESGGTAYMCSNESPWAVSEDLAYGYAAVSIAGGTEESYCCACYELTFTSTALSGKKMIVQATNTGADLATNQFDISMPGGGVGIYNGCTDEWGAPSSGWGAQYGGISDRSACDDFPDALKDGCYFRFDWFQGADNPTVSFTQVACPAALTAKTGCIRADDSISESPTGASVVSTYDATSWASSATSGVASSSAAAVTTSAAAVVSSSAAQSTAAAVATSESIAAISSAIPTSESVAAITSAAATSSAAATTSTSDDGEDCDETTSSAAAAATSTGDDGEDCDDATSTSVAAAAATTASTGDDGEDCDDATTTTAAAAATSAASGDDGEDCDETTTSAAAVATSTGDDGEDCDDTSSASAVAAVATPTASSSADDEDDCDDETSTAAAVATATPAPTSTGDEGDDCEDETTTAATPTATGDEGDDCDDETTTAAAAAATSTGDEGDDCDDEGTSTITSAAAAATGTDDDCSEGYATVSVTVDVITVTNSGGVLVTETATVWGDVTSTVVDVVAVTVVAKP